MVGFTDVFANYPEDFSMVKAPAIGGVTPVPAQTQAKTEWYNNPGFWAEVGKIGSALLSKQQSPGLQGLAAAGSVASEYHTAKQLDKANTKMLANVAGGLSPMEGFEVGDTKGLTPEQVTGLNKTGLAKAEQDSQIASREKDVEYKDALISKMQSEQAEKEKRIRFWDETMEGWESGKMKKPSFISDEMVPLIKGLGQMKGEEVISELIKLTKQHPDTTVITDKEGGKVTGVDKNTGVKKWEMDITATKHDPKVLAANRTTADNWAFANMLPKIRDAYDKAMGVNPESKAKLNTLMATLNSPDPIAAANAKTTLLGFAPPELRKQYADLSNKTASSLDAGKGYPDLTDFPAAQQDATIKPAPGKQKVDMKLVSKAADNAKAKAAKEGRPATPAEIQAEYEVLLKGGKK